MAVMISICDKVRFVIISILLIANLVRYGITFDSEESHTYTDNLHDAKLIYGDYLYIVTIDPESEKAVDDKACHPTLGGESSVPCKTLQYAFEQFEHLGNVKFYLNASNHTYHSV